MDAGKWAREFFVLDDGRTIGAAQADHTVFWDVKTGQESGRVPEHVYGFSHDRSRFIAQNERGQLSIYAYPGLNLLAQFNPPSRGGVCAFLFSPDDRYCAVEFETAYPAPESTYPFAAALKNIVTSQMYSLDPVCEISNFASYRLRMGTFCPQSPVYFAYSTVWQKNNYVYGLWKFDLKTSQLTLIAPYTY